MKFSRGFEPVRATQAAAFIVRLINDERKINYMRLIELLISADHQSIGETGLNLTTDEIINIDGTDVLMEIYDCILGIREEAVWNKYFKTEGRFVCLIGNPGDSELSDFDVEVLERLAKAGIPMQDV